MRFRGLASKGLPVILVVALAGYAANFCAATRSSSPSERGPGGPILVVAAPSNPFTRYYAEILRAEGYNAFDVADIESVSPPLLDRYDLAILGEMPLTAGHVKVFSDWVTAGGNLIAMRPDKKLSHLLGLTARASILSDGYILVDTRSISGAGIVGEPIQFHGTADGYGLNGAHAVADLYATAITSARSPAVTWRSVGDLGGEAAAFSYDLARSVVYTRQGNPAWAGQERDAAAPIRPNDLFYAAATAGPQSSWLDWDKVAIPQADEQQRLLGNLISLMSRDRKPLPKFWYLPRALKAVVVMTGDDHAKNGTTGRWNKYISNSGLNCVIEEWECIRGTSYMYPRTGMPDPLANFYQSVGFEPALHVSTNCVNYPPSWTASSYALQLAQFAANFPSVAPPATNRTHCVAWGDWASQARIAAENGIRLDMNYYYYPADWVADRPGFFTGSGFPMRFADRDGTIIDVYQAATQMTDESGQTYPFTVDTLLDRALGPEGYYGVFTAAIHTDLASSPEDDAIVGSAERRGIPVITARQMLEWLDGRNGSSFKSLAWNGTLLEFTVALGEGARGLQIMLPTASASGTLHHVSHNGNEMPFRTETIKGIDYAMFPAAPGPYRAGYR